MVSGKAWLAPSAKVAGKDAVDLPSNMIAPLGAYQRYQTWAVLAVQVTPELLVTVTVGQYASAGQVGGGVPASFCGALPRARPKLPPLVPSGLVVPAYGSCTGIPAVVFSAITVGTTSSSVDAGSLSFQVVAYVVVP